MKISEADQERINELTRLRKEARIPYPRAKEIFKRLNELMKSTPESRPPWVLVYGKTNNGKSTLDRWFTSLNEPDPNPQGEATRAPVVSIEVEGPNIGEAYDEMLDKVGALFRTRDRKEVKKYQVLTTLKAVGTRLLVIDELNTAIVGNGQKPREFLNALKYISNTLEISIVAFGTDEARSAIRLDPQIENRTEFMQLPLWKEGDDFLRLLANFEKLLPLREPPDLQHPTLATKLYSMSEGYIGELAAVLFKAAKLAIETQKERIDSALLDKLGWEGPGQRNKR